MLCPGTRAGVRLFLSFHRSHMSGHKSRCTSFPFVPSITHVATGSVAHLSFTSSFRYTYLLDSHYRPFTFSDAYRTCVPPPPGAHTHGSVAPQLQFARLDTRLHGYTCVLHPHAAPSCCTLIRYMKHASQNPAAVTPKGKGHAQRTAVAAAMGSGEEAAGTHEQRSGHGRAGHGGGAANEHQPIHTPSPSASPTRPEKSAVMRAPSSNHRMRSEDGRPITSATSVDTNPALGFGMCVRCACVCGVCIGEDGRARVCVCE